MDMDFFRFLEAYYTMCESIGNIDGISISDDFDVKQEKKKHFKVDSICRCSETRSCSSGNFQIYMIEMKVLFERVFEHFTDMEKQIMKIVGIDGYESAVLFICKKKGLKITTRAEEKIQTMILHITYRFINYCHKYNITNKDMRSLVNAYL